MKKLVKKGFSVFFAILFSFIIALNITVLADNSTNKDNFLGLKFLSSVAIAGGEDPVYVVCPPGYAAHHADFDVTIYCFDSNNNRYICDIDHDCHFQENACCYIY